MTDRPETTLPRGLHRQLKVSFILSSLWLSGGVLAIVEFANRLSARGHVSTLVIPKGTADPQMAALLAPGVRLVECGAGRAAAVNTLGHVRLALALAAAVPHSDVVVATHTPTTLSSLVATRLLCRGAPVWLFMDYAQMFAQRPAEAWLLRNALRWHRVGLTISRATGAELARYAPGRIEFVGVGISHLNKLTPVYVHTRQGQPPTIFFLGDGRPRKGLADFLLAAEQVYAARPEVRIVIAAKEPCQIETTVPYTFHLKPDTAALAALYQSCAMYVCASWAEGLGNNPLEAMACATPVVMTETGGSRDYAVHEGNCLLVPPHNPAALAAAVLRLLDDPALAARLSAAGPETAARFAWDAVMERLERALLEAAA